MRLLILLTAFLSMGFASFAQKAKIEGKVTDAKTGQPLTGVSVINKANNFGTSTDVEGRYSLNIDGAAKVSLVFTYNGVTQQVDDIEIKDGKVTVQDLSLTQREKSEEAVVVRAASTARKETAASLITFQKNTNTVASVISAESIRRSPDKNTGDVLKRTPGASVIDGKFLVIRGLADRYNQAMINGILLTSTEPDRKTFSFDIIPAPMIDNIIINKAFVPELPGEWAGGLIQVNTKDIPAKNFLNVQIGSGFNTQTIGKDFYKTTGGKTDWLGIDDGTRALPSNYINKSTFNLSTPAERIEVGKALNNNWAATAHNVSPNLSFQINGGFTGTIFGKKAGGILGINYSKSNRYSDIMNRYQSLEDGVFGQQFSYDDDRYTQEVTLGGLASLSVQLNPKNKIGIKAIVNVNTNNYVIRRDGYNRNTGDDVKGGEIAFKENTFFTTQLTGEHSITTPLKFKWYGSFNILDGYSPDQKRFQYTRTTGTQNPFLFLVGNSLAQESGSRIFQTLSDYIYTGGGDLAYTLDLFGQKQTIKGGYMLQVKDRLFDAQLFANYLPKDNATLRALPIDQIFAPQNFGDGSENSNLFAFNSINNRNFRYLANTILNAGFIQFDNQFSNKLRVVWGLRVENFDQLLGSVKQWDSRHKHTEQTDYLPGVNFTYKINTKTNIRLSGSQTVIRPEQRELADLTLYDFELNSAVQGNPNLIRTKVTNVDLRYEIYPRSGETISAGVFYKNFKNPIEQQLQQGGAIFTYHNSPTATTYGAEIELRKRLDMVPAFKNFTVQANAAYIHSEIDDAVRNLKRPLQGQSPYLVNLGLMYDLEKSGLNATVLFNQIGKRIYLVGDIPAGSGSGAPDIWEHPRPVLDFQLGKKLLEKKAEIRLNVSDILNRTQYFYQNNDGDTDLNKTTDAYRFTRRFGTTFSVTFNYSL
ncbi:TonB-dependent receptor [Ferruginibacter sp. HRS2-29]|uniref:TonB-dependent receptor n=1 Tax=Ferruginibacter sp. HRS2-29 TaxID=2487334 RepID=UPI0020CEAF47|nr:TonB-dependent receptor [Ferruginibacter sp. HRS2-29]MCP9750529.1 TonB-dependent receptor [Ferruginibacter sp. HRS2-29]